MKSFFEIDSYGSSNKVYGFNLFGKFFDLRKWYYPKDQELYSSFWFTEDELKGCDLNDFRRVPRFRSLTKIEPMTLLKPLALYLLIFITGFIAGITY